MDADAFFATEWARTAERIGRTLARHGVAPCDRADILQETALRLYRAWPTVDLERGVEAYARTIAINVVRDNARRPGHNSEVLGDVPERADTGDVVERTTLARLELGRVRRALSALAVSEQRLLTDVVVQEVEGTERSAVAPAAVRMARMRARRQLAALLQTASAVAAFVAGARRVARGPRVAALAVVGVAAVIAATVVQPAQRVPAPREVTLGAGDLGEAAHRRDVLSPADRRARPTVRATAKTRPAPRRARRPAAQEQARKPVRIPLPGGSVGVLVRVEVDGVRAEVRDRSERVPACVATPVGRIDDRVDC